jgi:AcrR family transcriptional regulator
VIVSIPYEQTGRSRQKSRTRKALVAAARDLLERGITASVEQAAAAADVSRPTAYRYFKNQRELIVAANPEMALQSLLPQTPPSDPLARLDIVSERLMNLIMTKEVVLRAMLRISLEEDRETRDAPALRTGKRIVWVEDALAPLKRVIAPRRFHKLVLSIAAVLGIEVFVWLVDVAGVKREAAVRIQRASARDLLRAAL